MRGRALRALTVAILSFVPATGLATVRPAIEISIEGAPRAAVPGQPFTGVFFVQGRPRTGAGAFRLHGEGWTITQFDPPSKPILDRSHPLRIPFTAISSAPLAPLQVEVEVDGQTVVRTFDLSPAAILRISRLHDSIAVGPPVHDEKQGVPHLATRLIRLHGRIVVARPDGRIVGLDSTVVTAASGSTPLGTTSTAIDGSYDFTVAWNPCAQCLPDPDLYVRCEACNAHARALDAAFLVPGPASCVLDHVAAFAGTDLDLATRTLPDNIAPYFYAACSVRRNWYWHFLHGHALEPLDIVVDTETFYGGTIHSSAADLWSDRTLAHEYGHHWTAHFTAEPPFDYCNMTCDDGTPPMPCGHCLWCPESGAVAWVEGFADWTGETIPKTYLGTYGAPASEADAVDFEHIPNDPCIPTPVDGSAVEGCLAASLLDVADVSQDDQYPQDPWRDRLAMGDQAILNAAIAINPQSAAGFLTGLAANNPTLVNQVWQTARNNGIELDFAPPPIPTSLVSTDHTVNVPSPNAKFTFTWSQPPDDLSGVDGYAVLMASSPTDPGTVVNLSATTTFTSPPRNSGISWFTIKSHDRADHWSTGYAIAGPYVFQDTLSVDMRPYAWPNWAAEVIPRPDGNAVQSAIPAPTTLGPSNWFNVGWGNFGFGSSGIAYQDWIKLDGGEAPGWDFHVFNLPALNHLQGYWFLNIGPYSMPGGRHTLTCEIDANGTIPESNELNNTAGQQWCWTPVNISNSAVNRSRSPRYQYGGWGEVNFGATFDNCTGFRFTPTSTWSAVSMRSKTPSFDQDLYLFATPSAGSTSGFDVAAQMSMQLEDLEAVFVNSNVAGAGPWDVGVVNHVVERDSSLVQYVPGQTMIAGSTATVTMQPWESLKLFEFALAIPSEINVQITSGVPAAGGLTLMLLGSTTGTAKISSGLDYRYTDAAGYAAFQFDPTPPGTNAIAVYRQPDTGNVPLTFTIRFMQQRPNLVPSSGWEFSVVPRPAPDGTDTSVPTPSTLPGDVPSTFLNVGTANSSYVAVPAANVRVDLDGVAMTTLACSYAPHGYCRYHLASPYTVAAGRHVLASVIDPANLVDEINENDNVEGQAWIWTPAVLGGGVSVLRGTPPDPYGGLGFGSPILFQNADGIRTPITQQLMMQSGPDVVPASALSQWEGVAMSPPAASDYDLRLHEIATNAETGFTTPLVSSAWGPGESEYVLANFRRTPFRPFDAGTLRTTGTGSYRIEVAISSSLTAPVVGTHGPFSLPANRILALHEVFLDARPYRIALHNISGSVDWGLALHDATSAFQARSGTLPGGSAWLAGAGIGERIVVTPPVADYYCIAVWKNKTADVAKAGSYQIEIDDTVTDAEPSASIDSGGRPTCSPNPMRGTTRVLFHTDAREPIALEIYNVRGHLVRRLNYGELPAGAHEIGWDGRDAGGLQTPAGVYVARLTSGPSQRTLRIVKLAAATSAR